MPDAIYMDRPTVADGDLTGKVGWPVVENTAGDGIELANETPGTAGAQLAQITLGGVLVTDGADGERVSVQTHGRFTGAVGGAAIPKGADVTVDNSTGKYVKLDSAAVGDAASDKVFYSKGRALTACGGDGQTFTIDLDAAGMLFKGA